MFLPTSVFINGLRKIIAGTLVCMTTVAPFFVSPAYAAIPQAINYQSRLLDSAGTAVASVTPVQFSLYNHPTNGAYSDAPSAAGSLVWKESYDQPAGACASITPDSKGYFYLRLGSCSAFPSYLTFNEPLYLGVKIGSDPEATPRVPFSAHPYALNSERLNNLQATTTAQANKLLSLDSNQNFNIATGTFMGAGLLITGSSTLQNFTFAVATGTSLNLTTALAIGGIRLDAVGTDNITSGASLVGVFDEFDNSNATTVQAALRDFDAAITAVSSSVYAMTLQKVTDNGNTTTNAIVFAGGTSTAALHLAGRDTVGANDSRATELLNVLGGATAGAILKIDADDGAGAGNRAGIYINSDYANGGDGVIVFSNNGTQDAYISSDPSTLNIVAQNAGDGVVITASNAHQFRFEGSGNFGIGNVTADLFKLQVSGHAGPSSHNLYDLGSATTSWRNLWAAGFVSTSQLYVNGLEVHGGTTTLDMAYDGGGSGLGRFITADAGPITITGLRSPQGAIDVTNATDSHAVYVNNTGVGVGFSARNMNTGSGFYARNQGSGNGLHVDNGSNVGRGIYVNNNMNGRGIYVDNPGQGDGITIEHSGDRTGFRINNTGVGRGAYVRNDQGTGFEIDNYSDTYYGLHIHNNSTGYGAYVQTAGGSGIYVDDTGSKAGIKVNTTAGTGNMLELVNSADARAIYIAHAGSQEGFWMRNTGTGPSLWIEDQASDPTSPFVLDADGNLGVATADTSNFALTVGGDAGPDRDDSYDLGSEDLSWRNIWSKGFVSTTALYINGQLVNVNSSTNIYTSDGSIPVTRNVTINDGNELRFLDQNNPANYLYLQTDYNSNGNLKIGGVNNDEGGTNSYVEFKDNLNLFAANGMELNASTNQIDLYGSNAVLTIGGGNQFNDLGAVGSRYGLRYADDYSSDFVARSLVDKAYVDNAIVNSTTTLNAAYNAGGAALGRQIYTTNGANPVEILNPGTDQWETSLALTNAGNGGGIALQTMQSFGDYGGRMYFTDDTSDPENGTGGYMYMDNQSSAYEFGYQTAGVRNTSFYIDYSQMALNVPGSPSNGALRVGASNYNVPVLTLVAPGTANGIQVSVGTSTPEGRVTAFSGSVFHRTDGVGGDRQMYVKTTDGGNTGWVALSSAGTMSDADNDTKIQVEETTDEDYIRFDTAGVERMYIANDGKIGVGTTAPLVSLFTVGPNAHESSSFSVSGIGGMTNIANFRDKTGENVFRASGSVADGDLVVGFGDLDYGGNGTSVFVDYANNSINLSNSELRFFENASIGNYVGFIAPSSLSDNTIWTLPSQDGAAGQVLTTDGSGVLSWGSAAATGDFWSLNGNMANATSGSVLAVGPGRPISIGRYTDYDSWVTLWSGHATPGSDNPGGDMSFNSGYGDGSGNGGNFYISAGEGGNTTGGGGIMQLSAGSASNDGNGGAFYINGGSGSLTGTGGEVSLVAGAAGNIGPNGGLVRVKGGYAENGNGGYVNVVGGYNPGGNDGRVILGYDVDNGRRVGQTYVGTSTFGGFSGALVVDSNTGSAIDLVTSDDPNGMTLGSDRWGGEFGWTYNRSNKLLVGTRIGGGSNYDYVDLADRTVTINSVGSPSANPGFFGINNTDPQYALDVNSAYSWNPIASFNNINTGFRLFSTTGTPEGAVIGNMGDIAVDADRGMAYIKQSGMNTRDGWVNFATGTGSGAALSLQQVTDNGNVTTNAIQFAGGTSTNDLTIVRPVNEARLTVESGNSDAYFTLQGNGGASTLRMSSNNGGNWATIETATNGSFNLVADGKMVAWADGPTGNLGLGTTSPDSMLHVYSDTQTASLKVQSRVGQNAYFIVDYDRLSGGEGSLSFQENGVQKGVINSGNNGYDFFGVAADNGAALDFVTNGTVRMHVATSTGYVGVGTTSPDYMLDVNGAGHFKSAWLDGQLMLAAYPVLPASGSRVGSLVYNSSTRNPYFWNGSSWIGLATGTTPTQHWQKNSNVLSPTDANAHQISVTNNSASTLTGFKAVNTNDVSNYAGAVMELKGSGADFTNNVYFGKYGSGFWIPTWAGNGVLATDKSLVLGAVGTGSIIRYQIGGGYSSPATVATMDADSFDLQNGISMNVGGNTTLGDGTSDTVTYNARVASHVLPSTNNTFDLGSPTLSWRNIYASGTIYGNITGYINPGYTEGSVMFQGASSLAQDNSNFYWDDSANRLMIGTNATSSATGRKLEVNTNVSAGTSLVYMRNGSGGGGGRVLHLRTEAGNSDEAVLIDNRGTNAGLKILNGGSGNVYGLLVDSGRVGFGTTTPATQMQVVGTSTMQTILPEAGLVYDLGSSAKRWNNAWVASLHIGTSTWDMAQADNGGLTIGNQSGEKVRVSAAGNMGIGDADPSHKLTVYGGATAANDLFKLSAGANNGYVSMFMDPTDDRNSVIDVQRDLSFRSSGWSQTMMYMTDSAVGIGTVEPTQRLSVAGDAIIGQYDGGILPIPGRDYSLIINSLDGQLAGTQGNATLNFQRNQADIGRMRLDTSNNLALQHYNGATWNNDMIITTSSRVGLSTATPNAKLHVSGTMTPGGNAASLRVDPRYDLTANHGTSMYGADVSISNTGDLATNSTDAFVGMRSRALVQGNDQVADLVGGEFGVINNSSQDTKHAVGVKIDDLSVGGGATVDDAAGLVLEEQTGATYNANLLLGTTSVPAGNYNIYSPSVRDNYLAGDLGLGSTSPDAKLEVSGDNSVADVPLIQFESSDNSDIQSQIYFTAGGNATYWNVNSSGAGGALIVMDESLEVAKFHGNAITFNEGGAASTDFRVESDTQTHALFVDATNGYVGFDQSVPLAKLHVGNTTAGSLADYEYMRFMGNGDVDHRVYLPTGSNLMVWDYNVTGNGGAIEFRDNGSRVGMFTNSGLVINDGGLTGIGLRVEGDTSANLLYTDAANDRVGIGTNVPSNALHVVGTVRATTGFSANNGTAGSPSMYFTADTNTGIYSSGSDVLDITAGGTRRLSVNNGSARFIADHTGTDFLSTVDVTSTSAAGPFVTQAYNGVWIHPKVSTNSNAKAVRLLSINDSVITVSGLGLSELAGISVNGASFSKSGAASITNAYGLFISAPTIGSTNYALYTTGQNRFLGNLNVGPLAETGVRLAVNENGATVASFNRYNNDGTIISIQQDSVEEGTISVAGNTVSYNAFTGSHYAWTDETIEQGMLVRLTENNRRLHNRADSEILYGVVAATSANDPRVLGAYLALQEPTKVADNDNPHLIAAVGNGDVWIVDQGQNVASGDYLISSDVKGHAMKDVGAYPVSYVFARAAEPIDWSQVTSTVDGVKHAKISVFFESFARNNSIAAIQPAAMGNVLAGTEYGPTSTGLTVVNTAFPGSVTVLDHVELSKDSVGQAVILVGATRAHVSFERAYDTLPIVTVTPHGARRMDYGVENVSLTGFDIVLDPVQYKDILFDWHAFGEREAKVFVSNGTTSDIELTDMGTSKLETQINATSQPEPTPVAEEPTQDVSEPAPVVIDSGTQASSTEPVVVEEPLVAQEPAPDIGSQPELPVETATSTGE